MDDSELARWSDADLESDAIQLRELIKGIENHPLMSPAYKHRLFRVEAEIARRRENAN